MVKILPIVYAKFFLEIIQLKTVKKTTPKANKNV